MKMRDMACVKCKVSLVGQRVFGEFTIEVNGDVTPIDGPLCDACAPVLPL